MRRTVVLFICGVALPSLAFVILGTFPMGGGLDDFDERVAIPDISRITPSVRSSDALGSGRSRTISEAIAVAHEAGDKHVTAAETVEPAPGDRGQGADDPSVEPGMDNRNAETGVSEVESAIAQATNLALTFHLEGRERNWAEAAEGELGNRIAQAIGLQLTSLSIECRKTTCRTEFIFPTAEYMQTSGADLAMGALKDTSGYESGGLVLVGNRATLTYYMRLRER